MDGGLMAGRPDQTVDPMADALGELAEALGLPREGGEPPAAPGSPEAPDAAASRIRELAGRARELSAGERRARQAAASFRAASLALSRSPDSSALLEQLLDYLNWIVAYDAAQVFLANPGRAGRAGAEVPGSATGPVRDWRSGSRSPLEREVAVLSARAGGRTLVEERGRGRLLYLPLRGPDGLLGEAVIARDGKREFDEEEVREAEAFAGQAAAALRNASLYEALRRSADQLLESYESCLELLSKTLDLRDHETEGHSLRVAEMSTSLARVFGMSEADIVLMRRGALLHDIGKIGIPDAILLKSGPLDEGERSVMELHPSIARDLFAGIPFLRDAVDVPWCHHERWDGRGYPRGLAMDEIPLPARIFAVVDVWDALTHDRPYRKAIDEAESLRIIAAGSGTHFEPQMVQFFLGSFDLF
jgi:hypothetical protein